MPSGYYHNSGYQTPATNDQLFGTPAGQPPGGMTNEIDAPGKPKGEDTPGQGGAPGIVGEDAGKTYAPGVGTSYGQWGRRGGSWYQDQNGNWQEAQSSGSEEDIDRWRQMGAEQYNRPAYQTDLDQSNQTRGQQQNALSMMADAAAGRAPSASEIAGKASMNQALAGQISAAGSVRGGAMAQASAMRNASRVNAANQAQMTAGIQAGRAAEMGTARGQYAGALQGVRQEDIQGSALQQQSELSQRQLNQQAQQNYEQLGYNVENAQEQADLQQQAMAQGSYQYSRTQGENESNADRSFYAGLVGSDANIKRPALLQTSDMRVKVPAGETSPVPSYGGTGGGLLGMAKEAGTSILKDYSASKSQQKKKSPPSWLGEEQQKYNAREDQMTRAQRGEHTGDIVRKNPYDEDPKLDSMLDARAGNQQKPAAWLDNYQSIQHEDPYPAPSYREGPAPGVKKDWTFADEQPWKGDTPGPNDVYSDKETKVEAHAEGFQDGVKHAVARGVEHESKRPLYVSRVTGSGQESGYTTDPRAANQEMPPVQPGDGPKSASQKDPAYLRRLAQQAAQKQADYASGAKRPLYLQRTNGAGEQVGYTNDPAAQSGDLLMTPSGPATASQKDPEYLRRYGAGQMAASDEKTKKPPPADPEEEGRKAGEKIAREAKGGIMAEGSTRPAEYSDERTKYAYSSEDTKDIVPLEDSDQGELHQSVDDSGEGHAYYQPPAQKSDSDDSGSSVPKASLSGSASVNKPTEEKSAAKTMDAAKSDAAKPTRKMTEEEMSKEADRLIAMYKDQAEAAKTAPSAVQSTIDRQNVASPAPVDTGVAMAGQQGLSDTPVQTFSAPTEANLTAPTASASTQDYSAQVPAIGAGTSDAGGGGKSNGLMSKAMTALMFMSDERTKEDANRRMKSSTYAYKDDFVPPEQKPGEVNYGPMAQELERNPLTNTAIKKDANGIRMVDMAKLVKVHSGSISNLQEQIDEMKKRPARRL